jgi:hypothetical protein
MLVAPDASDTTQTATINFHGSSVAFVAGVHWGSGTLRFRGKGHGLRVSRLSVGAIGANSRNVEGEVFNLPRTSDIEGAGALDMINDKGIEIRAHTTSEGLKPSLERQGVVIQLRR